MMQTCFLAVLLFAIPSCFGECVLKNEQGTSQYFCNSVRDLERHENPNMLNISINKPRDTSDKILNIKIVLVDGATATGLSPPTIELLKEIVNLFKGNSAIGILPSRLFQSLPIKELYLRVNGINNIEVGAFSSLEYLKSVYIVDNILTIVRKGIFNNIPLNTLALSRNKISFIEKDAFRDMPHLTRLYLDGNRLTEFQPEIVMNHPHSLKELYLQDNSFIGIDRNTIRGLVGLKYLNLNNNKIAQCASYTFDDALNIEILDLGNNLLQELKAEAFPSNGMQNLRKLYIHNNRLSYLTNLGLEKIRKLEHIRLGGNPWQCPCLEAILTWVTEHKVQQNCDQEYYNGTRPICVVSEVHPIRCVYENDISYYQSYSEINNQSPPDPNCVL